MNRKKFSQRWVKNLIASIDENLNEKTKIKLMESCGRACAREEAKQSAKACRSDVEKFLSTMKKWIGKENVKKDGKTVTLVYPKCFCQLVADGPSKLPNTYCYCSQGWLKEMFETVVGKPVSVKLIDSIKRGAKTCTFTIRL